ncbi:uncharacterized protein BJ212DRAFT_1284527, partial [Suillus subaureus]
DHLPLDTTQVPIILGSDKTPMTRTTGGLEMYPNFITISNLDSDVCSKAILQAWHCIVHMPIAKFRVHPGHQFILQVRLWHKCIDLVCANLKLAAKNGCFMSDPSKFICYIFMSLITHICDLPEASMIAAVSKNVSPLMIALQENFGDGVLCPLIQGNTCYSLSMRSPKQSTFEILTNSRSVKNHAQRRERPTQRGLASARILCPLPEYVPFISEEVQ